ncbi:MAG: FkbM family methyltransferase [Flavobacteriales bacterium]|nr:FkbM family methyltransferase [Flavobacteriales bacterium]
MDAFCAEQRIERIDFLKLDIEGSELPALKGAERLLREGRIGCVMVETTLVERTRDLTQRIDDLMKAAGFRSFHASRDGRIVPVDVMKHTTFREDVLWLKH